MKNIGKSFIFSVGLIAFLLLIQTQTASAQTPTIEWIRQFGSPVQDGVWDTAADTSGLYVSGVTKGAFPLQTALGLQDIFVRKYDKTGNVLWTHQFGTSEDDGEPDLATDSLGNIYISFTVYNGGVLPNQLSAGGPDAVVRKYDGNGNELWTRQFGTSRAENARTIAADANGVYVVGLGSTPEFGGAFGGSGAFVRKYDAQGNELWTKPFIDIDLLDTNSATLDLSGNLYFSGRSRFTGMVLRKIDAQGNHVWTRPLWSGPVKIDADATGVYIASESLRKYNFDGTLIWTKKTSWTGISSDRAWYNVVSSSNGGIFVTGLVGLMPGEALGHYDAAGNESWVLNVSSAICSTCHTVNLRSVAADNSGAAYVVGNVIGSLSVTTGDVFVERITTGDNVPPQITCPANVTTEATSADGATVNYSPATATDLVSTPTVTYSHASGSIFPIGNTTVIATATDAAGNKATCSFSITVRDTTPPETSIISAVDGNGAVVNSGGLTLSNSITFAFSGTDAVGVSGFQCRLDGEIYTLCTTPKSYSALAIGSHTFQVRAIDTAGNLDSSPASFTWSIITPAQAIQNLITAIKAMDLPFGVTTSLIAPLDQASALLNDNNPNNDIAACGKLGAFINQVSAKVQNGQLTSAQANTLLNAADAIKTSLGCPSL